MPRLYLPLEVDFDDDDKVSRLARYTKPGEARALRDLLVAMWRYCKRNATDGHVPLEQLGKLVYPDTPRIGQRDADRLVDVGLAERTDDGYYLHGYLKRNKSRAQLEAEAAVKAEAGRKGGKRSGEVRRSEAPSQAQPEADRSSVLRTSEARDRDRDRDRDKSSTTAVVSPNAESRPITRILRAYADAAIAAGNPAPAEAQRDVENSARSLLEQGFQPHVVEAAARNAGTGGWRDLTRQIQIDNRPPSRPANGRRTTDDKVSDGLALAQRLLTDDQPRGLRAIGGTTP